MPGWPAPKQKRADGNPPSARFASLRWLIDHPEQAGVQPGLISGLGDARLARTLTALHERPGESWSLQRMAAEAGMSRSAFASAFKTAIGQPQADYLADWRLSLAQARLRQGRQLKQIADELGYANASALCRLFSQRLGQSPRQWLGEAGRSANADTGQRPVGFAEHDRA